MLLQLSSFTVSQNDSHRYIVTTGTLLSQVRCYHRYAVVIRVVYCACSTIVSLQCFDAVGWMAGRASGL